MKLDYEIDLSGNSRLVLMRIINEDSKRFGGNGGLVYLTPIILSTKYNVNLQTLQSVLFYLEEHNYIAIDKTPNHTLTDERRIKQDDEEDYYIIDVNENFYKYYESLEDGAVFFNADTLPVISSGTMSAELTIDDMCTPIIVVDKYSYRLPAMRAGTPLDIISFCLQYHPNQTLGIKELKEEMKAKGLNTYLISNIHEVIRKSLFGEKNPLGIFSITSSVSILVKSKTQITQEQLQKISRISKL